MGQFILRVFAGLLVIGMVWVLFTQKELSIRQLIGFPVVAVAFGIYAVAGKDAANNALAFFLGHPTKRTNDDSQ
jgi:hypothetical protein